MLRGRGAELGDHDGPGDPAVGGDRQGQPGVVIEPGQDLGAAAISEGVMGEIGLPALVGQLRGEPHIRRAGPFARLWGDQPGPGPDSG